MSQAFEKAVAETKRWEGGFTVDTGGETRFGISKKAFPSINILTLTWEKAKRIYYKYYWKRLGCDRFDSDIIASLVFDTAVNTGNKVAAKILQRSLNSIIRTPQLIVDGLIGPKTISVANKTDPEELELLYRYYRLAFYSRLVAKNPAKYSKYLRGWRRRAVYYMT